MKTIDLTDKRVIISRTDSIGDVILTLPICKWIKDQFPTCQIIFLGKKYTVPILKSYRAIDEICVWDDFESLPTVQKLSKLRDLNADTIIHVFPNKEIAALAKKVKIPNRIGTSHRSFHLLTCNHRLNFTRKSSPLHESQLNFELLKPFGLKTIPSLDEVKEATQLFQPQIDKLPDAVQKFIDQHPNFVILHPKSQGSALEWPIEKYVELTKQLTKQGNAVVFTGTEKEGVQFRGYLPSTPTCFDSSGLMTLDELIYFISLSKGLVACSTGPLHIAGILGVKCVGLYSNCKPIHPGRWMPIGKNAKAMVYDENCPTCSKTAHCKCIEQIAPSLVLEQLLNE